MTGYTCVTCGVSHDKDPACFLFDRPLYAMEIPEMERAERLDLTSDQCVVDRKHFFVLGNLDVGVQGSETFVRWSVWTSLSEKSFLRASELWQEPGRESEPPNFGWLGNQIPGYPDTVNIRTLVHTQPVGVRPRIEIIQDDHPLTADQRAGISGNRFQELIHAALYE